MITKRTRNELIGPDWKRGNRLALGAWADRAACAGVPVEVFYPDKARDARPAIREYCDRCPVQNACAAAGSAERHGVWGGRLRTTAGTRRQEAQWTAQDQRSSTNGADGCVA